MKYTIEYERQAIKSLSKIDKAQQRMILSWIEKNLSSTDDPRDIGKPLKGDFKGYWRYRVGHYRIIAEILDDKVKIIIVNVSHRKDVYR